MDPKCSRLLRELRKYLDEISAADKDENPVYPKYTKELDGKILEEIAATAVGGMSETAIRLIKKLENVEKTNKMIDERFPRMYEAHSSTDEDKVAEAIQEQEISDLLRTIEGKTAECVQNQEPAEHTSLDEGSSCGIPFPTGYHEKLSKERKTFLVQMNVSNFSSKEVKVNVNEKYLEIHAKHDKLIDEHGVISREFTRKFDIPGDVDPETFRALYDCYGVLHVEASFMPDNTKYREIKIFLDEETANQYDFESFEDLGKEFEELTQSYIKDGCEMAEFARNLVKQHPSDYIPIEEVIIP